MVGSVLYMVYMQNDKEVFDLRCVKLSIFCSVGFNFKIIIKKPNTKPVDVL